MELKISVLQFQPEIANPETNIGLLGKLFDETSDSSLVILPELANAGYNFKDRDEAAENSEVIGRGGIFQDFLLREATVRNTFIVSGICEREGDKLFNTAILAGPGGIIGKYRKNHLFLNEKDIFTPGSGGYDIWDLGGWKVGIMICFDYMFPEPWGILARKGVDVVCHPSNLITMNPHKVMPGLALMNRIYIATANRTGLERGVRFNGRSFVTDPLGNVIGMANPDTAEVLTCLLNTEMSRNKMATARNHVFEDRRPEIYIP
jgi:predicted amidohydrolase